MSETKTKERSELTFDGFGINGPDGYRTRLCTFNHGRVTEEDCQKYGKLFAASPDLLEELRECLKDLEAAKQFSTGSVRHLLALRAVNIQKQIARAEGRAS